MRSQQYSRARQHHGRPTNQSRRRPRHRRNNDRITLKKIHGLFMLVIVWTKHQVLNLFRVGALAKSQTYRREQVYVDASFNIGGESGGQCGIGIWLPRRGVAIALKAKAATSMEAETLAILAGAFAANHYGAVRPVIFSDCKTAIGTAKKLLHVERSRGIRRKLERLLALSSAHRAYRHIYDALQGKGCALEWRPREDNREADLASSIGSRIGNVVIDLGQARNRAQSLSDVLSRPAGLGDGNIGHTGVPIKRQKLRCGTEITGLAQRQTPSSRGFAREARRLIGQLSRDVA